MRIQCPQCEDLFDSLGATAFAGTLYLQCSHCQAAVSIPFTEASAPPEVQESSAPSVVKKSSAQGASQEVSAPAGNACPKCGAASAPEVAACASCGLASARFADFQPDEGVDALEEPWLRLQDQWDSEDEHEAFMGQVAGSGDFRGGAARYRRSQTDPARAERSRKMLDRIQSMATATLLATKPKIPAEKEPFKGAIVMLLVLVMVAVVAGTYFVVVKAKGEPPAYRPARGGSNQAPAAAPAAASESRP
jgi:hypothetical protein